MHDHINYIIVTKIKIFFTIFKWLINIKIFGSHPKFIEISNFFELQISKGIAERGGLDMILRLKAMRVSLYQIASGAKVDKDRVISYNSKSVPMYFSPLSSEILSYDKSVYRYCLTLLQVGRLIPGWKKIDFSSIIDFPSVDLRPIVGEFRTVMPKLFDQFKLESNLPYPILDKLPRLTTAGSSGPSLLQSNGILDMFLDRFPSILKDMQAYLLQEVIDGIPKDFPRI